MEKNSSLLLVTTFRRKSALNPAPAKAMNLSTELTDPTGVFCNWNAEINSKLCSFMCKPEQVTQSLRTSTSSSIKMGYYQLPLGCFEDKIKQ